MHVFHPSVFLSPRFPWPAGLSPSPWWPRLRPAGRAQHRPCPPAAAAALRARRPSPSASPCPGSALAWSGLRDGSGRRPRGLLGPADLHPGVVRGELRRLLLHRRVLWVAAPAPAAAPAPGTASRRRLLLPLRSPSCSLPPAGESLFLPSSSFLRGDGAAAPQPALVGGNGVFSIAFPHKSVSEGRGGAAPLFAACCVGPHAKRVPSARVHRDGRAGAGCRGPAGVSGMGWPLGGVPGAGLAVWHCWRGWREGFSLESCLGRHSVKPHGSAALLPLRWDHLPRLARQTKGNCPGREKVSSYARLVFVQGRHLPPTRGDRHQSGCSAAGGGSLARLEGLLWCTSLSFKIARSRGKRAGHSFDLETLLCTNSQDLACFRERKKGLQLQGHPSGAWERGVLQVIKDQALCRWGFVSKLNIFVSWAATLKGAVVIIMCCWLADALFYEKLSHAWGRWLPLKCWGPGKRVLKWPGSPTLKSLKWAICRGLSHSWDASAAVWKSLACRRWRVLAVHAKLWLLVANTDRGEDPIRIVVKEASECGNTKESRIWNEQRQHKQLRSSEEKGSWCVDLWLRRGRLAEKETK